MLGHEVSHVANGDMVTLALMQGVLNTFVIFLSRVVGRLVDSTVAARATAAAASATSSVVFVLDMVFGLFASMIAMWFSRHREFRADAGGATLAGRDKMIAALERLAQPRPEHAAQAGRGVRHQRRRRPGLKRLFMTHPPLDERIAALRKRSRTRTRRQDVVA